MPTVLQQSICSRRTHRCLLSTHYIRAKMGGPSNWSHRQPCVPAAPPSRSPLPVSWAARRPDPEIHQIHAAPVGALWKEAVALETFDELVYELRNDSYLIDECSLLTLTGSNNSALSITPLVASGCAVRPEVRLLEPLSQLDPLCLKQSIAVPTVLEQLPPTNAQQLCSTCHPYLRLVIARQFLERHLPPNPSTWHRAQHLSHIQCILVSFSDAQLRCSGNVEAIPKNLRLSGARFKVWTPTTALCAFPVMLIDYPFL